VTLLLLIVVLRATIAAELRLPGWEASDCETGPCPPDTPHHRFPLIGPAAPPICFRTCSMSIKVEMAPTWRSAAL